MTMKTAAVDSPILNGLEAIIRTERLTKVYPAPTCEPSTS